MLGSSPVASSLLASVTRCAPHGSMVLSPLVMSDISLSSFTQSQLKASWFSRVIAFKSGG